MAATGDTWDMGATGPAPNRNTRDSRIQGLGFWVTVRNLGRRTLLWIRYKKGESLGGLQDQGHRMFGSCRVGVGGKHWSREAVGPGSKGPCMCQGKAQC